LCHTIIVEKGLKTSGEGNLFITKIEKYGGAHSSRVETLCKQIKNALRQRLFPSCASINKKKQ
jgi:hypothetical protein